MPVADDRFGPFATPAGRWWLIWSSACGSCRGFRGRHSS